jgi:hypothetical protein
MLVRKIIISRQFSLRCVRCFTSQSQSPSQPLPAPQISSGDDDWNHWEFGSFTTRKRKTTEQSHADRVCHDTRSQVSRNIDNEWSFLSDEEVETGILALKAASTEKRILKLESVLEKRTTNIRFVFVSTYILYFIIV